MGHETTSARPTYADSRSSRPSPASPGEPDLAVRFEVRTIGGEAGQALAAAQGRVLRSLLAIVTEMEVGEGDRSISKEVAG